jgi:predicted DNA-binding transcriptional regulator AlpA
LTNKTSKQATLVMLVIGTGSIYSIERLPEWQHHIEARAPIIFGKNNNPSSRIDVRTPIEHLENIRTVLNPPISELAILFGISRQAIYKWLAQDSFPEADKLARIVALSKIADAFKEAKIQRAGALLNMKISDGESLYDLLRTDKPYEKQLEALINESKIMEVNYQQSGLSQSNTKPTHDWLSSLSIPAYREDSQ